MSKLVKLHPNMTGIVVRDCGGNELFNIVHGKFYRIWPVNLQACDTLKATAPANAKWYAVREEEEGKTYTGDIPRAYFWLVGNEDLAFVPADKSEMKIPEVSPPPATAGMMNRLFKSPLTWIFLAGLAAAVLIFRKKEPKIWFQEFGALINDPIELIKDTKMIANRYGYILKFGTVPPGLGAPPGTIAFMLVDIERKGEIVAWSKDIREIRKELEKRIYGTSTGRF